MKSGFRHVYGPVPSRRLGRSLGIDLIPFKTCSYDCIYCQLGRTTNKTAERAEYFAIPQIVAEVEKKLDEGAAPDYITMAGSGEPTLHSGLGNLIRSIKAMTAIPVVVLTNGSLLWRDDVRDELMAADIVVPSLDAGDEALFQYVNRPHPEIGFDRMVEGTAEFTRRFNGEVRLEVFLLDGVTGIPLEVEKIAALSRRIRPARIELNTVWRPPGEDFAFPVDRDRMRALKNLFDGPVDIIEGSVSNHSAEKDWSGVKDEEILALLRRRPCTCEDVAIGLGLHLTEAIKHLDSLDKSGKLKRTLVDGRTFYAAGGGEESPA
jgi:wyosine [tRNA(Phe)-imidazoG37] synthetase (radical SAM superfamily)